MVRGRPQPEWLNRNSIRAIRSIRGSRNTTHAVVVLTTNFTNPTNIVHCAAIRFLSTKDTEGHENSRTQNVGFADDANPNHR